MVKGEVLYLITPRPPGSLPVDEEDTHETPVDVAKTSAELIRRLGPVEFPNLADREWHMGTPGDTKPPPLTPGWMVDPDGDSWPY